ncbi:hypothetical protein [Brevibacillus brevis]|uniref:hypothetical protein n=1 Tax=Brevibacillus brevis TaxID=1393 RepID=UPI00165E83D9|nr:hypothetical protein [Brevibacillus brevis]
MKKLITGIAALAIMTSAVPAFAKEAQQAPTTTVSTKISASNKAQASYVRMYVDWNDVPNAETYEVSVTNLTDSYVYERNRRATSDFTTGDLYVGKNFIISVVAYDKNSNTIASGNTGVFQAKENVTSTYIWIR